MPICSYLVIMTYDLELSGKLVYHIFLDDLDNLLHKLNLENSNIYFMGHFNIDLICDNDITADLNTLLNIHAMLSTISKPTIIDMNASTLIDNIFTNVSDNKIGVGPIYSEISDHLPIFVLFSNCTKTKPKMKMVEVCKFTEDNIGKYKTDLMSET